jgi:ATP-binding cassette subfamily B protein
MKRGRAILVNGKDLQELSFA